MKNNIDKKKGNKPELLIKSFPSHTKLIISYIRRTTLYASNNSIHEKQIIKLQSYTPIVMSMRYLSFTITKYFTNIKF